MGSVQAVSGYHSGVKKRVKTLRLLFCELRDTKKVSIL